MSRFIIFLFLMMYQLSGYSGQDAPDSEPAFSPFATNDGQGLLEGPDVPSSSGTSGEESIQNVFARTTPLSINNELVVRESYFRLLARVIEAGMSTSRSAGIELDPEEQRDVLHLINGAREENGQSAVSRMQSMCREWRRAAALPKKERANRALAVGKAMELSAITGNTRRQALYADVLEVIGENRADELEEAIKSHAQRSSTAVYSWSDMVRQTGREVEQFEFMCEE